MRQFTLLVAMGLLAGCSREKSSAPAVEEKVEVGAPAPAYGARTLAGDSITLTSLQPKVVLLNVWATWCGPCRKEIPELRALHAKYKDRGLEVVGVSVDAEGSTEAIQKFVADFKMDYPVWNDPFEVVSTRFRMSGVPATFLIDKRGILRWKATGVLEPGDTTLTAAIERAISSQ